MGQLMISQCEKIFNLHDILTPASKSKHCNDILTSPTPPPPPDTHHPHPNPHPHRQPTPPHPNPHSPPTPNPTPNPYQPQPQPPLTPAQLEIDSKVLFVFYV